MGCGNSKISPKPCRPCGPHGNAKIHPYGHRCGGPKIPTVEVTTAPLDTVDYSNVTDKPRIQQVVLEGNRNFDELGLPVATDEQIESMFS